MAYLTAITLRWQTTNGQQQHKVMADDEIIIGRSATADLVLPDQAASGEHARIWSDDGVFYVRNQSSTNPLFIKHHHQSEIETLQAGEESTLQFNDTLIVGKTPLHIADVVVLPDELFKVRCSSCGRIVEGQHLNCPWCGVSVALGGSIYMPKVRPDTADESHEDS